MSLKNHLGRIAARAAAGIAVTAALASCGGGTYQVSVFKPTRILSFGDESSKLVGTQGLKYSINGLNSSTNQIDCSVNPIWTQKLAANYGLVYANCNTDASISTAAYDETTIDATVDDVTTQVNAFTSLDQFNSNDLVTIWVGVHDVIEEYQTNGTGDNTTPINNMQSSGAALAKVVNAIVATGAKVILLTIPDVSLSPYGYTEAQRGDFDRAKLLSDMSSAFNLSLRSNIVNDGSKIGLVLVDDYIRNAVKSPGSYSYISLPNRSYGCNEDTAPLPSCTTATLSNDPSTGLAATSNYLWADSTHLGANAQSYIGTQAVSRATSNPF